jgi:hypothetical protein
MRKVFPGATRDLATGEGSFGSRAQHGRLGPTFAWPMWEATFRSFAPALPASPVCDTARSCLKVSSRRRLRTLGRDHDLPTVRHRAAGRRGGASRGSAGPGRLLSLRGWYTARAIVADSHPMAQPSASKWNVWRVVVEAVTATPTRMIAHTTAQPML